MLHQRHVIREAIVAALAAANTAAGARVYDHPYDPRVTFPALTVEDLGEMQGTENMPAGPNRIIERSYVLQITAEVRQVAQYARQRDQLLADVEAVLASLVVAGVKAIVPQGYTPDLHSDADLPVAVGRQRFEVTYYTPQGNPSVTR